MVYAAEQDPAAGVRHSSIRDIETVICGSASKEAGRLLPNKGESGTALRGEKEPGWSDVTKNLVINRDTVQDRISKLDMAVGRNSGHWNVAHWSQSVRAGQGSLSFCLRFVAHH